ncbi:MAG TPA: hypothetical protein VJA21_06610, partial [Verrucomicrobiae bacterium]
VQAAEFAPLDPDRIEQSLAVPSFRLARSGLSAIAPVRASMAGYFTVLNRGRNGCIFAVWKVS